MMASCTSAETPKDRGIDPSGCISADGTSHIVLDRLGTRDGLYDIMSSHHRCGCLDVGHIRHPHRVVVELMIPPLNYRTGLSGDIS